MRLGEALVALVFSAPGFLVMAAGVYNFRLKRRFRRAPRLGLDELDQVAPGTVCAVRAPVAAPDDQTTLLGGLPCSLCELRVFDHTPRPQDPAGHQRRALALHVIEPQPVVLVDEAGAQAELALDRQADLRLQQSRRIDLQTHPELATPELIAALKDGFDYDATREALALTAEGVTERPHPKPLTIEQRWLAREDTLFVLGAVDPTGDRPRFSGRGLLVSDEDDVTLRVEFNGKGVGLWLCVGAALAAIPLYLAVAFLRAG